MVSRGLLSREAIPAHIVEICSRIRAAGGEAFVVGGACRDLLLGKVPKDFDVATNLHPNDIAAIFPGCDIVGASFLVSIVNVGSVNVDVATFRADGVYSDCRHPSSVRMGSLAEDASRRDFTCNAIYYDPIGDLTIDPSNGVAHIAARQLVANGDAQSRIVEDRLRIIRAARISLKCGLIADRALIKACMENADGLCRISPERVRDEITSCILHGAVGVRALRELGVIAAVLPEVERLWQTPQDPVWHPEGVAYISLNCGAVVKISEALVCKSDALLFAKRIMCDASVCSDCDGIFVNGTAMPSNLIGNATYLPLSGREWMAAAVGSGQYRSRIEGSVGFHTEQVLDYIQHKKMILSWAALLHDVGKPDTFSLADGRIIAHGHASVGAAVAESICERLNFPNAARDAVVWLVDKHMEPLQARKMKRSTLRRLVGHALFDRLLDLHTADCLGSATDPAAANMETVKFLECRVREFRDEPALPKPLLTGKDILAMGINPGPTVGTALRYAYDLQLEGAITGRDEGVRAVQAWLSSQRDVGGCDPHRGD